MKRTQTLRGRPEQGLSAPIAERCRPFALCDCSYWANLFSGCEKASDPGVVISTVGWILVGAAVWLVVATGVGMVIGRTIRLRERQVFDDPEETPHSGIPSQNMGSHDRDHRR